MNIKDHFVYIFKKSFNVHLFASIFIRLSLVLYGHKHDQLSEVPYTDVDYKVVTDGARHILEGESPFLRHTYRYSPLLALLQTPAVFLHPLIGKCIYSLFDIFIGILIFAIVSNELRSQLDTALSRRDGKQMNAVPTTDIPNLPNDLAKLSALVWLYNPITMVISTRGNGDSFSSFFVLLTIYFIKKTSNLNRSAFLAGLSHGLSIHLRLYPIVFSLAYYLCLTKTRASNVLTFGKLIFQPNKRQLLLVMGTIISLTLFSGFFYRQYGWEYIYEAYVYHVLRKDIRHNFSLYFLLQYLSGSGVSVIAKLFIIAPQLLLLIHLTFAYGQFRRMLPFCIFAQTFIVVTYNSVVTSQYFVWYLALLPICINNLKTMPLRTAALYFAVWLLGQGLWLLPAYLLEFRTYNTFNWVGGQAVLFFLINIFLLRRMIDYFKFIKFNICFKKKIIKDEKKE